MLRRLFLALFGAPSFVAVMRSLAHASGRSRVVDPVDSVITFNFDRVLDVLGRVSGSRVGVSGLVEVWTPRDEQRAALHKLHGAVNWIQECAETNAASSKITVTDAVGHARRRHQGHAANYVIDAMLGTERVTITIPVHDE